MLNFYVENGTFRLASESAVLIVNELPLIDFVLPVDDHRIIVVFEEYRYQRKRFLSLLPTALISQLVQFSSTTLVSVSPHSHVLVSIPLRVHEAFWLVVHSPNSCS